MKSNILKLQGNIVDIFRKKTFKGEIIISNGYIKDIAPITLKSNNYILPGFIDSHIHIESSMLIPSIFAHEAIKYGTIATISDPHEIANVCGFKGVEFMIRNSKRTTFNFFFGAPSCVPATTFETNGATISPTDIEKFFTEFDLKYLSEVMDFNSVINKDATMIEKINVAKKYSKKIDGHAPGLTGINLEKYIKVGIDTDHECTSLDEAIKKINLGMKIQIREGSAAKNFDNLIELIDIFPDQVMICSDDLHPDDLKLGYLNKLFKKAIEHKINIYNFLMAISYNPVKHYNLPIGLLRINDPADFIVLDNFENCNILQTYIKGKCVYKINEKQNEPISRVEPINNFNIHSIKTSDLIVKSSNHKIKVIEAINKELFTNCILCEPKIEDGNIISDVEKDLLKIVVVNRYFDSKPQIGFIKGFGLLKGAIASSICHDSHNIISLGTNDLDIANAINRIIELKGGIAVVSNDLVFDLSLDIAGLMSTEPFDRIVFKYQQINNKIKEFGSKMTSPLMMLSFMGLLVIPELKISDKGLFDVNNFKFTSLFE